MPAVSSVCDHHGEEPPISGRKGSGTIFFAGCNLKCVFCQNHQISQPALPYSPFEITIESLAEKMLMLQRKGAHNINLVSPSHFVPQIASALKNAAEKGLSIPIVYNSNGYDSVEALKLLEGMIDIYMPDYKYAEETAAKKYSDVDNYPQIAQAALKEMYRQVGGFVEDEDGIGVKGLLIRHLVLPQNLAGTDQILKLIAEELGDAYVSLMAQYRPTHRAFNFSEINRRITKREYNAALQLMHKLGLEGYTQDVYEAPDFYLPDFNKEHPFED